MAHSEAAIRQEDIFLWSDAAAALAGAVVGTIGGLLLAVRMSSATAAMDGLLIGYLTVVAYTDWTRRLIPYGPTMAALVAWAGIGLVFGPGQGSFVAGVALGAAALAMSVVRPSVAGMGDVWMVFVVGLLAGWQLGLAAFVGMSVLAAVVQAGGRLWRRGAGPAWLPAAPFMLVATGLVLAFAPSILGAYAFLLRP